MAIVRERSLFSWRNIEAASDLDRLRLVLSALPDERLVCSLERRRGKGRDDYPIRPMWNVVIAGIVFQHPSAASLLRELCRNAQLRELCGFDPLLGAQAVPTDEAMSRFLALVMTAQQEVEEMFHELVARIAQVLPDLGTTLAVDSKAISSFGRPVTDEAKRKQRDGRRDTEADWGCKSYKGKRKDGTAWEKVIRWFGYKLHLLVDSKYELPLAFSLTKASAGDSPELLPLVEEVEEKHAEMAARARELAADKAYDSAENKAALFDDHGIKPFIDHRQMWKENPGEPRQLFPDRVDVFLYDELGRLFCQAITEQRGADQRQEMAFDGFEKDRGTLKYRCPSACLGTTCPARADCEKLAPLGVSQYGRVLRIPLDTDRRIFTPVPRHTLKWQKAYNRRSSVERVNSRLDRVLGFELHTIRGMAKMKLRVTLALVVMLAMALGRIQANQPVLMRSLTAPVARAA
jgi:hypothetical protein